MDIGSNDETALEWPVNVAIFASREETVSLEATIRAVSVAAPSSTVIDVLINGNAALGIDIVKVFGTASPPGPTIRVWSFALADKANAWNWYVHDIWSPASSTFFVDGYVRVRPDALSALRRAASDAPRSLAATGVPTSGRSSAGLRSEMLSAGGLHGNLYMLTRSSIELIRARRFRLPLGIYRTDSTLGAALSFAMDPASNEWSPRTFIAVSAHATWDRDVETLLSYRALNSYFKRRQRQAQGILENAAVSDHLASRKLRPETLPRTVEELVLEWARASSAQVHRITRRSLLSRQAMRKMRMPRDWSLADAAPALLLDEGRQVARALEAYCDQGAAS